MYLEPRLIPYVALPDRLPAECPDEVLQTTTSGRLKGCLATSCPDTKAKDWKRVKKVNTDDGGVLRVFDHVETNQRALIETTERGSTIEFYEIPNELETKIIEAANQITHCGDYGVLLWNPVTQSVIMVLGDADPLEPHFETCLKFFTDIPGVKTAELYDEHFPYDEDDEDPGDWKNLGIRGKAGEFELEAIKALPENLRKFGVNTLKELNEQILGPDGRRHSRWALGFLGDGPDPDEDDGKDEGPPPPRGRSLEGDY
jgi:hypothetical protein